MGWSEGGKRKGQTVDPAALLDTGAIGVLCDLLRDGALVSFGLSRDGGSMSCTVTFDGEWDREWFRDTAELGGWLMDAQERISQFIAGRPPATGGNQRSPNGAPRRSR